MKPVVKVKSLLTLVVLTLMGLVVSCSDPDLAMQEEADLIAEDVITDYYYEDADDMAGVVVAAESGAAGGKTTGNADVLSVADDRICAAVSVIIALESTLEHPVGDILIDFGTGCEDPRGNVRSGKIRVHFDGRRFLPGSKVIITFENYLINGIKLKGTRILTNVAESTADFPKFQVELDGSIEWPDGTIATRKHCYVREWVVAESKIIITQCIGKELTASGTNRRGVEYEMIIQKELVYKRGCPIAVSGIKQFVNVTSGKMITVNYGNGDCDRIITISADGRFRTFEVKKRG